MTATDASKPYVPAIVAVRQDDGTWAAYDDNKFEGDSECLSIGRGDTRIEALDDLCEAYLEDGNEGETLLRISVRNIADGFPSSEETLALFGRLDAVLAQLFRRIDRARPEPEDTSIEAETTAVRTEMAAIIARTTTARMENA